MNTKLKNLIVLAFIYIDIPVYNIGKPMLFDKNSKICCDFNNNWCTIILAPLSHRKKNYIRSKVLKYKSICKD